MADCGPHHWTSLFYMHYSFCDSEYVVLNISPLIHVVNRNLVLLFTRWVVQFPF